jgi:hypothetical protein
MALGNIIFFNPGMIKPKAKVEVKAETDEPQDADPPRPEPQDADPPPPVKRVPKFNRKNIGVGKQS